MNDKPRSDHSDRTKAERIERLRERLKTAARHGEVPAQLAGILQGILDLLSDEL